MHNYITKDSEVKENISRIFKYPCLGLDTETTGLNPYLSKVRLLQIALTEDDVLIFDFFTLSEESIAYIGMCLAAYMEDTYTFSPVIIGQGLKFDIQMLWMYKIDITGTQHSYLFDTLLAEQLLENGLRADDKVKGWYRLDSIVERNLGIEVSKEEQTSDWGAEVLTEQQLYYAERDAGVMHPLYKKQGQRLQEAGLTFAADLDFKSLPAIASMEFNGFKLDIEKWEGLIPDFEKTLEESEKNVLRQLKDVWTYTDLFGNTSYSVSLGSSKQLLPKLQELGIPDPGTPEELLKSTGKLVIGMLDAAEYPVIADLLDWRAASKSLTSFLRPMRDRINPVTNRLHTDLIQHGTITGRVSSRSPNLNQIPRDARFRDCFVAEDGYKIIDADYSSLELRLIAFMYGERKMLELYAEDPDADLHSLTTKLFLQTEDVDLIKQMRAMGKACNFLLAYAGGAYTLRNRAKTQYRLDMTIQEARSYHHKYHNIYEDIDYQHNKVLTAFSAARKKGNFADIEPPRTRSGRRILLLDPRTPNQLVNFPIQGTASDLGKKALADLYFDLKLQGIGPIYKQDCKILLYIYDEIILEAVENKAGYFAERLQMHMEKAGKIFCTTPQKSVPILAEPSIGNTWAEAK